MSQHSQNQISSITTSRKSQDSLKTTASDTIDKIDWKRENQKKATKMIQIQKKRLKHNITFEQKCPNIGWTNAVLFKDDSSDLQFFLPSYLVMKLKNFKQFNIQNQQSKANVVLILQIYYGDLPKQLMSSFKDKLQIQFNLSEKIITKEQIVSCKFDENCKMLTFTIRTQLSFQLQPRQWFKEKRSFDMDEHFQFDQNSSKNRQGLTSSLWFSPFQVMNQILFVTFNNVSIDLKEVEQIDDQSKHQNKAKQNLKKQILKLNKKFEISNNMDKLKKITIKINLMNFSDEHYKINMNSTNQTMLGHYSLAQNLLSTTFHNAKAQNPLRTQMFYLQMLIIKKKKLQIDLQQQKKQLQQKLQRRPRDFQIQGRLGQINKKIKFKDQLVQGMKMCLQIRKDKNQLMELIQKIQQNELKIENKQKKIAKKSQKKYAMVYRAKQSLKQLENKHQQIQIKIIKLFKKIHQDQYKVHKKYLKIEKDYYHALHQYYNQTQFDPKHQQIFYKYENVYYYPQNDKIYYENKIMQSQDNYIQSQIQVIQELYKKMQSNQKSQRLYFQYASFNIPVFKNPGVTLATVFIPLTVLTLIGLFIYFLPHNDFQNKIANIATLMIAYIGYFQILRQKIPKFQQIILMEILVYIQILSNIICLFQSYLINQNIFQQQPKDFQSHRSFKISHHLSATSAANDDDSKKSLSLSQMNVCFWISLILLIAISTFVIIAYIYHKFWRKPTFTKDQQFFNLCQKKEITEFTKWVNPEADVYFFRQESKLIPLKVECRAPKQIDNKIRKSE